MADNFDMVSGATLLLDQESQETGRRRAFRAEPLGLRARVHGVDGFFEVNDISAGGLNLKTDEGFFAAGDVASLDILIARKRYLSRLQAQVVRVAPAETALAFLNLNRHQELKLDKLVLEMQKYVITRLKSERDAQEAGQPGTDGAADETAPIRLTL